MSIASSSHATVRAVLGSLFHTPEYGSFELLERALVELDDAGFIERVTLPGDAGYDERVAAARAADELDPGSLLELTDGRYGLPGFVDLHVHAPQWPQAGVALDEPLDVWLDQRTFPLEARFSDPFFAHGVSLDLAETFLSRGTTTALYFGSAHLEGSWELARACTEAGQRAVVGKVVMDDPAANHDFYRDASPEQALADTEEFLGRVAGLDRELRAGDPRFAGVYAAVTPRFIPSCTDEVLSGLGKMAAEHGAYIQSHCNEGEWEHGVAPERYGVSDARALADFGLLGPRSVMAHCTYMDEADTELFRETGTAVAHCPISNAYFANSACPVRRMREHGVKIGLGTDVSGGFSPSLYDNIRQAVMASRMLEDGVDALVPIERRGAGRPSRISVAEALYLATKGGAEALSLPVGSFEVGRAFDMQVVDVRRPYADLTGFDVFTEPGDVLARILYLATPGNIRQVWVQGRQVIDRG